MNLNSLLRSLLPAVALAALVTSPAIAQQPGRPSTAASEFTITGVVIDSSTGSPVKRCTVTATLNRSQQSNIAQTPEATPGQPASPNLTVQMAGRGGPGNARFSNGSGANRRPGPFQRDSAVTDEHGRFALSLPSAGLWDLRASGNGYRTQAFDQHDTFFTSIVLTPEQPSYDLTFRLAPDSAITGIVLDEAGEPVRQAQISLFNVRHAAEDSVSNFATSRAANATTDDRGRYELASLAPGDYRLSVQARPWYATNPQTFAVNASATAPQPDTSLDVVYPPTWFPGTPDERSATTVTLRDGEIREADFQLLPVPAIHLRVPMPVTPPPVRGTQINPNQPSINQFRPPQIERISAGGNFMPLSMSQTPGSLDVDGLTTGLYRVQTPGTNGQAGHTTILEITSNSARYVDLSSAAIATATVTINIDGASGADNLPIVFTDATNPNNVFRTNRGGPAGGFGGPGGFGDLAGGGGPQRPIPPNDTRADRPARPARTIELPPGRYVVTQEGSSNFFLSGMTQGSTNIPGRLVNIPGGDSALTLHIPSGRAHLSGIASSSTTKSPAVGAMVLLVPITMGQPGSIPIIRRDQTNTDGSFDLASVIPGQYILIAIDHGWNVNWNDPTTLARYLTQGVPLDLNTPDTLRQNITAQLP